MKRLLDRLIHGSDQIEAEVSVDSLSSQPLLAFSDPLKTARCRNLVQTSTNGMQNTHVPPIFKSNICRNAPRTRGIPRIIA